MSVRVRGHYVGALRGATMYEWQVGRLYGGFLRRRYWCRRNLRRLVTVGWERD